MRGFRKKAVAFVSALLVMVGMTACSSEPCERCGDTPAKAYKMSNGEVEYYCKDCSSECAFCNNKAKHYYTSLAGIVFVCDECYEYINEIND